MNLLKKAISKLVIACCFSLVMVGVIYIFTNKQINLMISIVNMMSVDEKISDNTKLTIDTMKKRLNAYPSYGTVFANMEIESIGLKLPVYHGDDMSLLKSGVGHYTGSYFPGEGSFIIMAAHKTNGLFDKLIDVKIDDIIVIHATYGDYKYQVYDTKIIKDNEEENLFVKDNGEVLVLYTCYRTVPVGHIDHRYVVYAKVMD